MSFFGPSDYHKASSSGGDIVYVKHDVMMAKFAAVGYGLWDARCAQVFSREPGQGSVFGREGVEYLRLMDADTAARFAAMIDKAAANPGRTEDVGCGIERISLGRREDALEITEAMLNSDIDARLTEFFQSEYWVGQFAAQKVSPSKDKDMSFKWHKDGGPEKHVKIILYLSDSAETGGRTDFINQAHTRRLAEAGYDFISTNSRRADLSGLAAEHGVEYEIISRGFKAGEAVIFKPGFVLHRGIEPESGVRTTVTLLLMPGKNHWRKEFARRNFSRMQAVQDWSFTGGKDRPWGPWQIA